MDRLQELIPAGSRGLDAGCGAGARDVFHYWQQGHDILGVDAVEENILEARRLHPEIAQRVSVADLRRPLDYPDGTFDFILCNAVIQHIAPDIALGITLPEFARLLKPGGVLQLMFKTGNRVATVYDRDYAADRNLSALQSGGGSGPPDGLGVQHCPGRRRQTRRRHELQGPEADGPLCLLRPQRRISRETRRRHGSMQCADG